MKNNILVIFVDELRADALRIYGNRDICMPNLDRLARRATVYDKHYCSFPVCTPSRYSHFSGLFANQHGVWTNKGTLSTQIATYPRLLKAAGYHTAVVGKMHCSPTYLDMGFDDMSLCEQDGDGRFEDDYHLDLYREGLMDFDDIIDQRAEYRKYAPASYYSSFGSSISKLPLEHHSTSWITRNAVDRLRKWRKSGELLFVSYIKPHHPFDPPERYVHMYDDVSIDVLPGYTDNVPAFDYDYDHGYFDNATLSRDALLKMTRYYYAALSHIDAGIGEMIDILEERNLFDDTEIIFTSDHGDYMGYHHMALKQNHMYEPLMRIPLVIKYPGQISKDRNICRSDNTQIASAILSSLNLPASPSMNNTPLDVDSEYLYGLYRHTYNGKQEDAYMVQDGKYKLLVTSSVGNVALFDLINDPFELEDISDRIEQRERINNMLMKLVDYFAFQKPQMNIYNPDAKVCKAQEVTDKQKTLLERYFMDTFKAYSGIHHQKTNI